MKFDMGPDLLFVPADRPERFGKAAERASAVIIDLEDAVLPSAKAAARRALAASRLDPARTVVRMNGRDTAWFAEDLAALRATPYRFVMLPKVASAGDVVMPDVPVPDAAGEPYAVVALVESAAGVVRSEEIAAAPGVVALMWGAEDLVASMDGTASRWPGGARGGGGGNGPLGAYRDVARHARSRVLVAAKAFGKAAIDAVYLELRDGEGLRLETQDAVSSGFDAKAVLHPEQAAVVREAYRPTPAQAEWARRVLAASVGRPGAFELDGAMVDEVVLKKARLLLSRS